MSRNLIGTATLVALIASAGCGGQVTSVATEEAGLFGSEEQPALAGSLNRPAPASIGKVTRGATVKILSDTYGKDYWACHVRTASGQEGWVLCTSLDYKRAAGT